jgi:hypothetical protein
LATDTGHRYLEAMRRFGTTAFRLETRQSYAGSGEDEAFAAFLAGGTRPPLDADDLDYLASVRAARERGARWQRVHVIQEPLTDYLRYELTWEYGPNVDAGEEVGLVVVGAGESWPSDLPQDADFTLVDDRALFEQRYAADGIWLGIDEVTSRERIAQARRWRDVALRRAQSWRSYVASHPALETRVPGMREAS